MSDHTHAPAEEPDDRPDPDLDPASTPEPHGDLGPVLEEPPGPINWNLGPYPRNLDTGCDYAAVGSVAARRAS